jgi:hypothetical protein
MRIVYGTDNFSLLHTGNSLNLFYWDTSDLILCYNFILVELAGIKKKTKE